tara:strand:- start:414 stop:680 length:267 start_codon:yes stop_codon:yes gene_type:complete
VNEWSQLEYQDFAAELSDDPNAPRPNRSSHHHDFQRGPFADLPVQKPDPVVYLKQSHDFHPDFPSHQNERQFDLRLHLHENQQHSLVR